MLSSLAGADQRTVVDARLAFHRATLAEYEQVRDDLCDDDDDRTATGLWLVVDAGIGLGGSTGPHDPGHPAPRGKPDVCACTQRLTRALSEQHARASRARDA